VRADVAAVIAGLGDVLRVAPSGVLVSSPAGESAAGLPGEPVYDRAARDDIQGNIFPGFNKDHQQFLFLAIDDARRARGWLRLFEDPTRPSVLAPLPGYAGDRYPAAVAGACPAAAHIRKVNPRDGGTDLGTPADTLLRLLLRRGIPYGPPLAGVQAPSDALVRRDRGLIFIGYAATIEAQFEFIMRRWVNSKLHPRFGGHDPLIGQSARGRFIDLPSGRVALDGQWVRPTGGGYFFAPPVSAVAEVLGRR
jgi:hypothetical protein